MTTWTKTDNGVFGEPAYHKGHARIILTRYGWLASIHGEAKDGPWKLEEAMEWCERRMGPQNTSEFARMEE